MLDILSSFLDNCEDDTISGNTSWIMLNDKVNARMNRLKVKEQKKCKDQEVYCTICCENVKYNEYTRMLECKHNYHKKCIDKWCIRSMDYSEEIKCPICRMRIQTKRLC